MLVWKKDIQEFLTILETPEFAQYKETVNWNSWKYAELRSWSSDSTKKWVSQVVELMPDTHRVKLKEYLEDIGSELAKKVHAHDIDWTIKHGSTSYFKNKTEEIKENFALLKTYQENLEAAEELEKPFQNVKKVFYGSESPEGLDMSFQDFTGSFELDDSGNLRHTSWGKKVAYKHYKRLQKEEPRFKAGSVVYFKSNPLVYRQKRSYTINEFLNFEVKKQRGIDQYAFLRHSDELNKPVVVLGIPDIPPIDDAEGGRLYKVLPEGATRPFIIPERCFKKSPSKRRKKKND
jgi:hypothetical protein